MRIPLSWLREYTELPADATAEDLMADLVTVGFEEEAVHRPSDGITGPVVVGQVLSFEEEPQKNGKVIRWCRVQVAPEGQAAADGGDAVHGIVCGASNFAPGDKVVVTLPGAVLPGGFAITPRKTYGHVSDGMMASATELGLGEESDGIIVLADRGLDAPVGTPALEVLGMDDEAAEINVTPDRGYALSIRGVAREYALATGTSFTDPASTVKPPEADGDGYPVLLNDQAPIRERPGCRRFLTRVVRGIDPAAPVPSWMSTRLRLAGVRSISLVVDVTNYVMLEMGQPLHAYDHARLNGPLEVRRAREGETLETLDGQERRLHPEDLLIADGSGPVGLAGVMGGAATEVTGSTTDVVLEAANFEPVSIARTIRRHKLGSEASRRFQRGVDPGVAPAALQRAVDLLTELGGGTAEPGVTDERPEAPAAEAVFLSSGYVQARVGVDYAPAQVVEALEKVGASVVPARDGWTVTAPSWRTDLTDPAALSEEVVRIHGYDQIPARLPVAPAGRGLTRAQQLRRRVSQALAAAGLVEVWSYPFVSSDANQRFAAAEEGERVPEVRLANPLNNELPYLRASILPGLLETVRRNVSRGLRDLAVFEAGLVFHADPAAPRLGAVPAPGRRPSETELAELDEALPDQPRHLAAVLVGADVPATPGHPGRPFDWADALDAARLVAEALGVEMEVAQGRHQAFHPGRTAVLSVDDTLLVDVPDNGQGALAGSHPVGYCGELHPRLVQELGLPARTVAFELDLEALIDHAPDSLAARELSTYPAATQDVALVVDGALPAAQVERTLREGAGELLEDLRLFDVYAGEGVPEGSKSLAFALRFRAPDRTLTADEASAARQEAVDLAAERHGARLR